VGTSFLFIPLGKDPDTPRSIPANRVREAFKRLWIDLPELREGANDFFAQTQAEAPFRINEEMSCQVSRGEISSMSIYRPCSGESGRHLWYALIELGFVMIRDTGGAVLANRQVAEEAPYLFDSFAAEGVRVIKRFEDLP